MNDDLLIELYLANALDPAQRAAFLVRVEVEPALAARLVTAAELDALLADAHREGALPALRPRKRLVVALAAAAGLAMVLGWWGLRSDGATPQMPEAIWRVTATAGEVVAVGSGHRSEPCAGDRLGGGTRLEISSGARVVLASRSVITWAIDGAAICELPADEGPPFLEAGTATVTVAGVLGGSTTALTTPHGRVVVTGTAFRVTVDSSRSLLRVTEGTVIVETAGTTARVGAGHHAAFTAAGCASPRAEAPDLGGLLARYTFDAPEVGRVHDHGPAGTAADLVAADPSRCRVVPGALAVAGATSLRSRGAIPGLTALLDPERSWSLSCWVELPCVEGQLHLLFACLVDATNDEAPPLRAYQIDAAISLAAVPGHPQHLVLVREAGTTRVWIDGRPGDASGSDQAPAHAAVALLLPGLMIDADGRQHPCPITWHDLALFGRSLTDDEVLALFAAGPDGLTP